MVIDKLWKLEGVTGDAKTNNDKSVWGAHSSVHSLIPETRHNMSRGGSELQPVFKFKSDPRGAMNKTTSNFQSFKNASFKNYKEEKDIEEDDIAVKFHTMESRMNKEMPPPRSSSMAQVRHAEDEDEVQFLTEKKGPSRTASTS